MNEFQYVQMCTNLKTGEFFQRTCTIKTESIVSNGFTPDIVGLLKLLNKWNRWASWSAHPELRWFYCTFEEQAYMA